MAVFETVAAFYKDLRSRWRSAVRSITELFPTLVGADRASFDQLVAKADMLLDEQLPGVLLREEPHDWASMLDRTADAINEAVGFFESESDRVNKVEANEVAAEPERLFIRVVPLKS